VAERERRPPNPPTRVDDVVLFPNGAVYVLSEKEIARLDSGELLRLVPPPPPNWPEVIYKRLS
jgi:hypothetical protein